MAKDKEQRIKRILYQSWYRGCKETDKLLGQFAKENAEKFNDKELDEFEKILNEQDWDIWNWITGKDAQPDDIKNNSVMQKLMKFNLSESNYK